MTTIQYIIIKSNVLIQKFAYEMANARDKAFKAGEIKDGKTTDEWKEYRKAKVKLSQVISQSIKEVEQETRKEIGNELIEFITKEKNDDGLPPSVEEYFNEFYQSITNKEKQ